MFRFKKFIAQVIFIVGIFCTGIFAQQKGLFDKLWPRKNPPVYDTDRPAPALVEPHPDVVALQDSFANVVAAVQPAVVNISAVQITKVEENPYEFYYGDPNELFRQFFGGEPTRPRKPREYRTEGTGSGVLIDPEGYILTNNHVVQSADQLTITMSDNKTFKGKVIGTDPRSDLAVVKIKSPNPLPYVPLGDSASMRVGDMVLALGSPFGLEKTVTQGIVSAIRQSLSIEGRTFRNLFQTDAAINRGNSGGALVNIRGQLIGINTAIYAPTGVFSGIGFAIPVNEAKVILKDLIEKGYVERSWMGVEIAAVDDVIAQQFGLPEPRGALINYVVPDSPAAKAGLERGDIVVEFDGKKIDSVQILQDSVAATAPQKKVVLKIVRGGQTKSLSLTTEVMPKQQGNSTDTDNPSEPSDRKETKEWLGGTFSTLAESVRKTYSIPKEVQGLVLIQVPPNSLAADAGLEEGDCIRSVNRLSLRTLEDLKKIEKELDPKKGLVFDVVRQGRSFYLSYKSL